MNNNEQIQQYRYGNYVNALEIYAKEKAIENPIMDDTILTFVMQDIIKMCGWVDEYLQTHTIPDGENYYNRQDVIKYQDALNVFSQVFVDNTKIN